MEQKIFLEKEDDLEKAIAELTSSPAERIVLNIPKNSVLGASVHNFQALGREGMTAGKELAIESVDEHILELASLATIPAVNPVFRVREVAVTDIRPRAAEEKPVKKTRAKAVRKPAGEKKLSARKKRDIFEEAGQILQEPESKQERKLEKELERELENICEPEPKIIIEKKKVKSGRSIKFKLIGAVTAVAILGAGYFLVAVFLPKADINASIQKTTATFSFKVLADTSASSPSANSEAIILPGQLSVAKNNLSMNFLATGSSTVSTKAGGTLTVYNTSGSSVILKATTRFQSPEGKIFRLISQTTIPNGTKDVKVTADQVGSDYNVPPSKNWTIPGFKGTVRYDKFSAEAKTSMTGGASGNQIVPTEDEIKNAKLAIETALSDNLKSQTLLLSSESLRLLDNASVFSVTNETINSQADKDNNFNIFAAGELRQLVFDETMLKNAIMQSAAGTSTDSIKINEFAINYGTSTIDLAAGKMSFVASGQVIYEPKIDFDAFKNDILGKDADTLKTMLFALPGLTKANISLWPFWVSSVPTRAGRVNINVE